MVILAPIWERVNAIDDNKTFPAPFCRSAAPIHRSTASRFSTRRLLEEVLAIRSAAVRSSAVGTEPRNQTVSRLTLTWMFLLFSPGAVCNFLTIRIFRSCEVSGSVDCSGSAPCVGFGAEVSGGNVGGVAPAGVLRGCCATAGSDSANAITTTNLLLFFIIPLHLRQLEREERTSTTLLASIGVGFLDCMPLIHTSTDFGVGVVRDASKSSPVMVQPVVLFVDPPQQFTDRQPADSRPNGYWRRFWPVAERIVRSSAVRTEPRNKRCRDRERPLLCFYTPPP